jgi:DNA-binding response OmpR family regulator
VATLIPGVLMLEFKSDLSQRKTIEGRLAIIVSHDEPLILYLRSCLNEDGFRVVDVPEYRCIPQIIKGDPHNIIIFDMGISLMRGFKLYRLLHKRFGSPILALVGCKYENKIKALDAGADDCLIKPPEKIELLAHLHALLRRTQSKPVEFPVEEQNYIVNDLYIDPTHHQVKLRETEVNLTLTEFYLLLVLARKVGHVVSRRELLEQIRGYSNLRSDHTLYVHMCRLRKKIEPDPDHPERLLVIRGLGYKLSA